MIKPNGKGESRDFYHRNTCKKSFFQFRGLLTKHYMQYEIKMLTLTIIWDTIFIFMYQLQRKLYILHTTITR